MVSRMRILGTACFDAAQQLSTSTAGRLAVRTARQCGQRASRVCPTDLEEELCSAECPAGGTSTGPDARVRHVL